MSSLYQPLERSNTQSTLQSLSSDVQLENHSDVKLVLNFTPQEIEMIRSSWKEMISDDLNKEGNQSSIASSLFCIQFYSNLLSMEPELEKMFPSIKHQAMSFAGVLSTAILNLEELDKLDDYLNNLGKRHARILGIDPPHFELMGGAFLKTFQDRFGQNLTLGMERCWARLYTYLANSILLSGVDPVLRVEKVNQDIHNVLERSNTDSTSIFDQRSTSTSASSVYAHSHATNPSPLLTTTTTTASSRAVPLRMKPQVKKDIPETSSRFSKRLSSRAQKDDKECVIM
jgi:hemoglobin-like flavoprotein